jgi:hypothetical protein
VTRRPLAPAIPTLDVGCSNCGGESYRAVGSSPDLEMNTCSNEFRFVECAACGWTYLRDRPADTALDVIYPQSYAPHDYDSYLGPAVRWLRKRVLAGKARRVARFAPPRATVVDVGCGNGDLLRTLRIWRRLTGVWSESTSRARPSRRCGFAESTGEPETRAARLAGRAGGAGDPQPDHRAPRRPGSALRRAFASRVAYRWRRRRSTAGTYAAVSPPLLGRLARAPSPDSCSMAARCALPWKAPGLRWSDQPLAVPELIPSRAN